MIFYTILIKPAVQVLSKTLYRTLDVTDEDALRSASRAVVIGGRAGVSRAQRRRVGLLVS